MTSKPRHALTIFLLSLCIFGLFQVKFRVQFLHKELAELEKQLEHEKNSIHVLKAEWAYLNKPERLQLLAQKYLKLSEIKSEQVILAQNNSQTKSSETIQVNSENNQLIKASMVDSSKTNKRNYWRYKQRPDLLARRKK